MHTSMSCEHWSFSRSFTWWIHTFITSRRWLSTMSKEIYHITVLCLLAWIVDYIFATGYSWDTHTSMSCEHWSFSRSFTWWIHNGRYSLLKGTVVVAGRARVLVIGVGSNAAMLRTEDEQKMYAVDISI